MSEIIRQFETGQLRALVSEVVNFKSEEIEKKRKPKRLPGIVDSYSASERRSGLFSPISQIFSFLSHSFNARIGSGAAGCKYNGHKLPKNWTSDYPRCENCDKKITSLDEARPEVKAEIRRKRYWIS